MEYNYNEYSKCIDVISENGIFRMMSNGNCIYKEFNKEYKLIKTKKMNDTEYRQMLKEFCKNHNIDFYKIMKLSAN